MVPAFTTCQLLTPDMILLRATPDAIFRGAVVCPKFERYELKSVTMVFEVPSKWLACVLRFYQDPTNGKEQLFLARLLHWLQCELRLLHLQSHCFRLF